jgi:hypothetical protein
VVRGRATQDEWRVYYERAAEVRAVVGDPFRRKIQRETIRERILIAGAAVSVSAVITAFCLLTMR